MVEEPLDAALTTDLRTQMPFADLLAIDVHVSSPERVVCTASWRPEVCTTMGALHGGFLMAVADSVGALCAVNNLPGGVRTTTIESKTNFVRGIREGQVTFTSTPVHVGRTTIVLQTDATDERGKLVTRTTQTQAVLAAG